MPDALLPQPSEGPYYGKAETEVLRHLVKKPLDYWLSLGEPMALVAGFCLQAFSACARR